MTFFAALIVYTVFLQVFYYYAVSKPETKRTKEANAKFEKATNEIFEFVDELGGMVGTLNELVNSGAITNKIDTDFVSRANEVLLEANRVISDMMLDPMSGRIYPTGWWRVIYKNTTVLEACRDMLNNRPIGDFHDC